MQGGINLKKFSLLLTLIIVLCLSSCGSDETSAIDEPEPCEECLVCEECPISPFPDGLVLPQIYILGKLHWSTEDLDGLHTNIIEPIVAYFEAENHTVVSISVKTEDLSKASINTIGVEVIASDNDGNQESLYMGMLIEKVDGVFPIWEQESIGP